MRNHGEGRDDLILAAAYGYGEAQLAHFLGSLKRSGFSGTIALIVREKQARQFADSELFRGVDVVVTPSWRPSVISIYHKRAASAFWFPYGILTWLLLHLLRPAGRRGEALRHAAAARLLHPFWCRHFDYLAYLKRGHFRNVMVVDTRDVVFQTNPSAAMENSDGLSVSIETRNYTIAEEYWNSRWIKAAYGSRGLAAVGSNPVSCAGVTWGDAQSMRTYLELLTSTCLSFGPWALEHAPDQPVHNYLVWTGGLGAVTQMDSLESPVATLNATPVDDLTIDAGQLLNDDGTVVCVVHQYDRVDGLTERLAACASPSTERP